MPAFDKINSGIKGLDELVQNIRIGDNVVWQVDNLDDYMQFVNSLAEECLKNNLPVIYIRFAKHKQLLEKQDGLKIYDLSGHLTFESFTKSLHQIIGDEGKEIFYIFDCLSDLLHIWATDMMIGNFFMVTCPYLFELDTVAYFAIYRKHHSGKTIARIRETTQLLLDVHSVNNSLYVHPLKVWNRYSSTMFLPHFVQGAEFIPIINSAESAKILSHIFQKGFEPANTRIDFWDKLIMEAKLLAGSDGRDQEKKQMFDHLCELILGREKKILTLINENFTLNDLVDIMNRMVGSGYLGGKTLGMLLSRKILLNDKSFNWSEILEDHDSFYIGSDVFYSFVIQNGMWKLWLDHKTTCKDYDIAKILREKMLNGKFPEEIREMFQNIVDYFGQSPIIIRSSSLLEDSFGNAFAGKYESIFIVNQDTPEERLRTFENSVRIIFASTMNEDALAYRTQRGLDDKEEQMALLVQRVSGSHKSKYFFPDMAGVGISYNIFLWKQDMDPQAGMLRLVLGLGTRAVNRVEDDYPRIVALDNPLLKAHANKDDTRKYSQHRIDALDKEKNKLEISDIDKLIEEKIDLKLEQIAEKDYDIVNSDNPYASNKKEYWLITFDDFLKNTDFAETMQRMLKTIERNYDYPVDIEFTANFNDDNSLRINLLQCRPFQSRAIGAKVEIPYDIQPEQIFFRSIGFFMGGNIYQKLKRIIFIQAKAYSELNESDKYQTARIIGHLNRQLHDNTEIETILIGPGRWGSTTPSLGVPVSFSEINNFKAIVETSYPIGNLMPELSLGSHFFQDLIETNIYYAALYLDKEEVFLNKTWLDSQQNILTQLLPEYSRYENVIMVTDTHLKLISDIVSQKIICIK